MNIGMTSKGIPYSRYIMSWINIAGYLSDHREFVKWLESEGLKAEEIDDMSRILDWGGKMEFEHRLLPFANRSNVNMQKKDV